MECGRAALQRTELLATGLRREDGLPVIARCEAIHGPWCEGMDCHGAARLAMTTERPADFRMSDAA